AGMRFAPLLAMAGATIQARTPMGSAAAAQTPRTRALEYCGMSISGIDADRAIGVTPTIVATSSAVVEPASHRMRGRGARVVVAARGCIRRWPRPSPAASRRYGRATELRVDLVGVGEAGADRSLDDAELVEDVQGLPPGVACGIAVTGGVVRVRE